MSRLDRVMREKNDAIKEKTSGRKKNTIPVYDVYGKVITPEKKKKEKRLGIIILIFAALFGIFYVPGFFIKDRSNIKPTIVSVDETAIKVSNDYLKNHPDKDFDYDGIINSDELQKNTNPWSIDTDRDFLTDPCEINHSMSDPLIGNTDVLINAQKKLDKEKEKMLRSPYKIGSVILWAKDYNSKSIGSVVETLNGGYHFCGFNGYAQFTDKPTAYAYRVKNGVHSLLDYREKENVWEIQSGDYVELYDKPLKELVQFSVFGFTFYGPSPGPMKFLVKLLPHKGIFTANLKMQIDTEPDTTDLVTADIDAPLSRENSDFRFGNNNNSLNDLKYVMDSIKKGICISVSLYNQREGEYVGIIYGYDKNGNFLLADRDSLAPVGKLIIHPMAYKMMDDKGDVVSMSYFDFSGVYYRDTSGKMQMFDSTKGDHISFFAASTGDGTGSQMIEDHLKEMVDESEETTEIEKVGNDALEEIKKRQEEAEAISSTNQETTEQTSEATTQTTEATTASSEAETSETSDAATDGTTKKKNQTTSENNN